MQAGHPECAARIDAVLEALQGSGLLASGAVQLLGSSRMPTPGELSEVHPGKYIERLAQISSTLEQPTMVDESTYMAPGSLGAVLAGLGCALDLADHLVAGGGHCSGGGSSSSGGGISASGGGGADGVDGAGSAAAPVAPVAAFALIRPPGHHVLSTRPMGFGLVNSVSVVARYLQRTHSIRRILVFDFDVHHGNGTMDTFDNDPDVLYISCHQAGLWPHTGKPPNSSAGAGAGANINVPLPGGCGDAAARDVMCRIVAPAARQFRPDAVVVSAGYDGHTADVLAGTEFQTATYAWLAASLAILSKELCGPGRLMFVLEGGYDLSSLGASVVASLQGMLSPSGTLTSLAADDAAAPGPPGAAAEAAGPGAGGGVGVGSGMAGASAAAARAQARRAEEAAAVARRVDAALSAVEAVHGLRRGVD